jgi:nicotinate-nucleotide adenylyltransferase
MGADNLVQLPRWKHWRRIVGLMPFAVLPRPTYNHRALAGRAARRLRPARLSARHAAIVVGLTAPHWIFLPTRQHAASATQIRLAAQFS